jgi:hypothetical protein
VHLVTRTRSPSPAGAITAFTAALRHASAEADVISLSVSLGEHFFTSAEAASLHQARLGSRHRLGQPERAGPRAATRAIAGQPGSRGVFEEVR